MKLLLLSIFCLFCLANTNPIKCQALYPVDLNEKVLQSSNIIEGKVIEQRSFWNAGHTMIYTANRVEVYKSFKGTVSPEIEVMTVGGTVGLESIDASDLLSLQKDDIGVFFCYPNKLSLRSPFTSNTLFDVYASSQGCITYDLSARTASAVFARYASIEHELYQQLIKKTGRQPTIVNAAFSIAAQAKPQTPLAPVISSFAPQLVNAGATMDPANNLLTINGTGFGPAGDSSAILFDDANDGSGGTPYRVLASSPLVESWTNTQIRVRVPDRAGSGVFAVRDNLSVSASSQTPLRVNFSVLTRTFTSGDVTVIKESNLMNDNGSGGYTILYSTGTGGNGINLNTAVEKATFQRALNTWKEIAGANIIEGGTTGAQAVAGDGVNVVMFDNENTGNPPLASGVLAVCYSYSNMCTPVLTNEIQKTEFDIVIRNQDVSTGTTGFTAGPCPPEDPFNVIDLETVLLHELGHALNLAHVNDGFEGPPAPNRNPPKLMNYAIVFGVARHSPDYAALSGALYAVTPQPGNNYGGCNLSNEEMTPLARTIVGVDECPVSFPATSTPPGTAVNFDLMHATSNKFTDPAYNGVNCENTGTSVTNNGYYAIRSDNDGGNLNILVSGYATFPANVQGTCADAGVRLAVYQVNSCPAGQEFPDPLACRIITRNGGVPAITGLAANTNYLVYVDGVNNTKANFTLTFNGSVLPVTLVDFKASLRAQSVNLSWSTTREINAKEFRVEKSFDGLQFSGFAVVTAKGTAASENNYAIIDDKPYPGFTFYRLKMVDKDGGLKYSGIVKIKTDARAVTISRIFPNPTPGKLNLQLLADNRKELTLEAFDLLGKKVASYQVTVVQGANDRSVFVSSLPAGTYFLQVKDAAGAVFEKTKFIKY
jgi:hypothetical protein